MRLRPQIVDFIRLQIIEQLHHLHRVREIAVMQEQARAIHMRILVDVVDAAGVEAGGAADDAMNLIAFFQQQFGQIGTVLAGDAGDECFFHE
jgi:hypothetical protein